MTEDPEHVDPELMHKVVQAEQYLNMLINAGMVDRALDILQELVAETHAPT